MALCRYLAMTAAEIEPAQQLPQNLAYMACHFSVYGRGLSNFPKRIPEQSILILNDRIPICGHDPKLISGQLQETVSELNCRGILLDLQRPGESETEELVDHLLENAPCPICVSSIYAKDLDCPVFLPPAPLDQALPQYIAPWAGRDIWLDAAPEAACVLIDKKGATYEALMANAPIEASLADEALHCLYRIETEKDRIRFYLHRDLPQLEALLLEAEQLGITTAIGLYQQLHM